MTADEEMSALSAYHEDRVAKYNRSPSDVARVWHLRHLRHLQALREWMIREQQSGVINGVMYYLLDAGMRTKYDVNESWVDYWIKEG